MSNDILSPSDIENFLNRGFVRIRECFSRPFAAQWVEQACAGLYCSLGDPASWPVGRVRAPQSQRYAMEEVAPRAWQAACQLCGGRKRVSEGSTWGDGFLANFGGEKLDQWAAPSSTVQPDEIWHKDGDFFRHFLDSPEQGLLVIALFSDLTSGGGGTYLACDSVGHIARFLAERPQGVDPRGFPENEIVGQCRDFVEVTGEVGDVFLLHPFMLHTWSINTQRRPRFMINPPVTLRQPMCFSRPSLAEHSVVERGVLRALGCERLDFRPTAPRQRLVPERLKLEQEVWDRRARQAQGDSPVSTVASSTVASSTVASSTR